MSAAGQDLPPPKPETGKKSCPFNQGYLDTAVDRAEKIVAQISQQAKALALQGLEKPAREAFKSLKRHEEFLARIKVARENFKDIEERGEEELLHKAHDNLAQWKARVDAKLKNQEEKAHEPVIQVQVQEGDWGEVAGPLIEEHGVRISGFRYG